MDKLNITLTAEQKIFFSSDQHFGHQNVIRFCNRPFEDLVQMGETIISNWNSVVSNEDIVITMGDMFWFKDPYAIKRNIEKLNGKEIYIVFGNHDKKEAFRYVTDQRFHILDGITHIYLKCEDNRWYQKTFEIVCSHYPLMTWSHRDRGSINLFGHIHSGPRSDNDYDQNLPLWKGQQLDVGVDNQEYTPVSFEDVLKQLADDYRETINN